MRVDCFLAVFSKREPVTGQVCFPEYKYPVCSPARRLKVRYMEASRHVNKEVLCDLFPNLAL